MLKLCLFIYCAVLGGTHERTGKQNGRHQSSKEEDARHGRMAPHDAAGGSRSHVRLHHRGGTAQTDGGTDDRPLAPSQPPPPAIHPTPERLYDLRPVKNKNHPTSLVIEHTFDYR